MYRKMTRIIIREEEKLMELKSSTPEDVKLAAEIALENLKSPTSQTPDPIAEFRKQHPEETEDLTDEEVGYLMEDPKADNSDKESTPADPPAANTSTSPVSPEAPKVFQIPDKFKSDTMIAFLSKLPDSPEKEMAIRNQVAALEDKDKLSAERDALKAQAEEPMRIEAFNAEIKGNDSPIWKVIQECLLKHHLNTKVLEDRFIHISFPKGQFTLDTNKLSAITTEVKSTHSGGHRTGNSSAFQTKAIVRFEGKDYNSANAFANIFAIKYNGLPNSREVLAQCQKLDSGANGGPKTWHPFYFTIVETKEVKDNKEVTVLNLTKVSRALDAQGQPVK